MIRVTGPVFESGALVHSYACRQGRGQHAALDAARHWTRRTDWYGKMDVRKFYDSVDHEVLRRLLARRFREPTVLRLFDLLLASYSTAPGKGLPIGALTSQYLGNFYLDEFDRVMKATRLAPRYLRYMDDIVVWGDREVLGRVRSAAVDALASLGLELKHGGEWNRCNRGVPFLGFVVYPDRIRVGRPGRQRLRRKVRALEREWSKGAIHEGELQARGTSLFAHVATGDDTAWRRAVLLRGRIDVEGEAQEPRSRHPRRLLEQRRQELPLGVSQQERAWQPQQEPGLSCLCGSRHEDGGQGPASPDDVPSRSGPVVGADEPSGKPSAGVDIRCGQLPDRTTENRSAEAPFDGIVNSSSPERMGR